MKDMELQKHIENAVDTTLASLDPSALQCNKIINNITGGKRTIMVRKYPVVFIFAIMLIIVSIGTAVALILNPFEIFGQRDPRMSKIAPDSVVSESLSIQHEGTVVTLTNVHFDRHSLLIGYTIEGVDHLNYFTPSDKELAEMEEYEITYERHGYTDEDEVIYSAFNQAVRQNKPMGFVEYSINTPIVYADGNISINDWSGKTEKLSTGFYAQMRDFTSIPKEIQNNDEINLHIPVTLSIRYNWFDGEKAYYKNETIEMGTFVTSVFAAKGDGRHFEGITHMGDTTYYVSIDATYAHLDATVTTKEIPMPVLPEDQYYDLQLRSDTHKYYSTEMEYKDEFSIRFSFDGDGEIPEELNGTLAIFSDDGYVNYGSLLIK